MMIHSFEGGRDVAAYQEGKGPGCAVCRKLPGWQRGITWASCSRPCELAALCSLLCKACCFPWDWYTSVSSLWGSGHPEKWHGPGPGH